MAAIDEAPSLREGGPIFTFREAGAEYRSGGGRERGCLTCGAVVADAEHRTICELVGITPVMHGPRRCARCIREQREADRWANRVIAEEEERRDLPGHRSGSGWKAGTLGDHLPALFEVRGHHRPGDRGKARPVPPV